VITVLAVIGALSVVALLLIVIAPSRRVREEPPLDDEIQARLLLGEDPAEIDEELEHDAAGRAPVAELRRDE
jgi:hypothetical protein